jgi:hypothetical protein
LQLPFCALERELSALPVQASCTTLELHTDASVSELVLEGAQWSDVALAIRSDGPLRVTLVQPALTRVFIHLYGDVQLRIRDVTDFDDLNITGIAAGPKALPALELDEVMGEHLRVGGMAEQRSQPLADFYRRTHSTGFFEGSVRMHASVVLHAGLDALAVKLESTNLLNGRVNVRSLEIIDAVFSYVETHVGVPVPSWRAVLAGDGGGHAVPASSASAPAEQPQAAGDPADANALDSSEQPLGAALGSARAQLNALRITDSRLYVSAGAIILNAVFSGTSLVSNEQLTRLYSSSFGSGALSGLIELDNTSVSTTILGAESPTRLQAYRGGFGSSIACEPLKELVLGVGATIVCSDCADDAAVERTVCGVQEFPPAVYGRNYCAAWVKDTLPDECSPDAPVPTRPTY